MQITSLGSYDWQSIAASQKPEENSGSGKAGNTIDTNGSINQIPTRADGASAPTLSQSSILRAEMSIKLRQTVKSLNMAGLGSGNELEDLAMAYDKVHSSLNENSQNSNKHGKFLDDAFTDLVRLSSVQNAKNVSMAVTGSPLSTTVIDGVNPFVSSAEKQAGIFSTAFLKEYKKNGMDAALAAAQDMLNNMPETTSLFNISYKDFNILNEKMAYGTLLSEDKITDLLKESELSDYMKDITRKCFDHFKNNNIGYGLMLLPPNEAIRLENII